ncbi:hypothetical protein [Acetobacter tropicalis]|uniref:hypothetical protein n=1 Tax=Acetobacter tropicalis TaxID=104102 RepID=UPI0012E01958|nr:hypothetical protein [Acetobacter tropicalis]MBC9007551.1 hypothetical protein [Acetobacter tropicalis]
MTCFSALSSGRLRLLGQSIQNSNGLLGIFLEGRGIQPKADDQFIQNGFRHWDCSLRDISKPPLAGKTKRLRAVRGLSGLVLCSSW